MRVTILDNLVYGAISLSGQPYRATGRLTIRFPGASRVRVAERDDWA